MALVHFRLDQTVKVSKKKKNQKRNRNDIIEPNLLMDMFESCVKMKGAQVDCTFVKIVEIKLKYRPFSDKFYLYL